MVVKYIILAMFIGIALAQTEPSISDAIASLPPELQGKVDEKQVEEIKNKSTEIFKDKCLKNGGADAFSNTEKAFEHFKTCLTSLVDVNVLQDEIENAKPNGQVDEVFKKYCDKTPKFKGCFRNMTEAIKPCFSPAERKNLKVVYNVTEQLAEFICFKDGDRIALFISEGGPDCLKDKQEAIQNCVNETVGIKDFDQSKITEANLPNLEFGEKECRQLSELQVCVVRALETCPTPASANIVDSLFKFVRKATPCRDHVEDLKTSSPNSAQGLVVPTLTLVALATLLV